MDNEKAVLEIEHPKFHKSRFRVYYGNIGEIIVQEVLRKQGFEVYWVRSFVSENDYICYTIPSESYYSLDSLNRQYNSLPLDYREKVKRKQYVKEKREYFAREVERTKAFFGNQREAFENYLKNSRGYRLDLVAKKSNKIFVIEVKSTRGALPFLKGEKRKGLALAKEYGFIPALVSLELRIEASNFKMVEIS